MDLSRSLVLMLLDLAVPVGCDYPPTSSSSVLKFISSDRYRENALLIFPLNSPSFSSSLSLSAHLFIGLSATFIQILLSYKSCKLKTLLVCLFKTAFSYVDWVMFFIHYYFLVYIFYSFVGICCIVSKILIFPACCCGEGWCRRHIFWVSIRSACSCVVFHPLCW